jgi:hypothetical protein
MFRISTESEFGIKKRKSANVARIFLAGMSFFLIVPSLIVLWISITEGHAMKCFSPMLCLTLCIFLLFLARPLVRGDWELDSEEIAFTSLKGIRSTLKWIDVNAVRFAGASIPFRGPSHMPPLPLICIENVEQRAEVLQFVRERITSSTSIDLSEGVKKPFTWRRFMFCLALSLLLGGLPSGVIFLQVTYLSPGSKWLELELLLFLTSLLALVVWALWKEDLKKWHVKTKSSETSEHPA